MGILNALQSELFRARRMHIGLVLLAFYAMVALVYMLAGSGAWVSAGAEGTFMGFSADPSYFELIKVENNAAERTVAAALAHTIFFPIFAAIVVGMFFNAPRGGSCVSVSFARGMKESSLYLARAVVASVYLTAGYMLFTLAALAVYFASDQAIDVNLLIQRTFLNILLNASYIALCVAAFAIFRIRALVSGGLVVVTFAGLIASMSSHGSSIPVHMSYWMRMCGIGASGMELHVIAFSLASIIICVLIFCGSRCFHHKLR